MWRYCLFVFLMIAGNSRFVSAEEKLVLEIDLENDLLSLSHNIENFIFSPSRNFLYSDLEDINDIKSHANLRDHLTATALVRMNDEIVGFATEQEIVYTDRESQHPVADSMWMFVLNHRDMKGFLAVKQKEDAYNIFSEVDKVMEDPGRRREDRWNIYLSTSGETRVQFASGDLSKYEGGIFEEYNGINQADYSRYNRFRGKIKFFIYPRVPE